MAWGVYLRRQWRCRGGGKSVYNLQMLATLIRPEMTIICVKQSYKVCSRTFPFFLPISTVAKQILDFPRLCSRYDPYHPSLPSISRASFLRLVLRFRYLSSTPYHYRVKLSGTRTLRPSNEGSPGFNTDDFRCASGVENEDCIL